VIEARREKHVGGLPPATRSRYERIVQSRDGRAVVAILKGACGGCFRNQPPQVLQDARRRDRLLTCEGCGRLVIWPPDVP
jgi:predicted  nucleic acid-binding Zn-ribbon protein